jgi:hypothetical protein
LEYKNYKYDKRILNPKFDDQAPPLDLDAILEGNLTGREICDNSIGRIVDVFQARNPPSNFFSFLDL